MDGLIDSFGGKSGPEQNALMTALINAAGGEEDDVYEWLDETPKAGIVTDLVVQLHLLGYAIAKQT